MSRKIFFSFHYERDAWRAGNVRNSNMIPNEDEYGYIDSAEWEKIKQSGDETIKRWIAEQLNYTSVTVVLIGAETADRPWVQHEIIESWNRGNAVLGIYIHNIKDDESKTDMMGVNPLTLLKLNDGTLLSEYCATYDWVTNDGRTNMGYWAELAYSDRSKVPSDLKLEEVTIEPKVSERRIIVAPMIINNPPSQWCS